MRLQRPGLIVLGIFLVAALVYLWIPDAAPTGPGGSAPTGAAGPPTGTAAATPPRTGPAAETTAPETRSALAAGPTVALRGEVLGVASTPVLGATVIAHAGSPHDRRLNMTTMMATMNQAGDLEPGRMRRDPGPVLARATVDANGHFEFTGLRTAHLRLTLDHDFYGLAQPQPVHLRPDRSGFTILRPFLGGHLVGRIRGPRPAAGETVRLVAEFDPMYLMRNPADFVGQMLDSAGRSAPVAAADGRFEFRAVLPSSAVDLSYRGAHATAIRRGLVIAAGQKREVVLQAIAGGQVTVTVAERGQPVATARVRLVSTDSQGQAALFASLQERTDDRGVCTFDRVLPGGYHVDVDGEGYVGVRREAFVRPDQTVQLAVELSRGRSVQGTVVDPDGQPVADAGVRVIPTVNVPILGDITQATGEDLLVEGARNARQRTDAAGRFELFGIGTDQELALVAWHRDFAGGLTRGVTAGAQGVEIRMRRAARITGQAIDAGSGAPLADFTVQTLERMMLVIERPTRSHRVAASTDGRFELTRVAPGKTTVQVQALGFADFRRSVEVTAGGAIDLGECRLEAAATIRGVVRTAAAEPVAGVTVGRRAVGMLDNPMLQSMFGSGSTITDRAGRFELTGLAPGAVILKASSATHASGTSERLQLAAGEVREGVEIVLATGGSIAGRLLLNPGIRPQGWMITVSNQKGGSMRSTMVADDGTFHLEGIDAGRYDVQGMQLAWMRNLQSRKVNMLRPGADLDLGKLFDSAQQELVRTRCRVKDGETTEVELDGTALGEAGVAVTVRVTLGDRPMPVGWLEAERVTDGHLTQCGIQDGLARLAAIQPGSYRLTVRSGITMTPVGEPETITVPVGKTHAARLRLAGGAIAGRVVDAATGEVLADAMVRVVSTRGDRDRQLEEIGFAVTGDAGEFRFDGLADGEYSLFANDAFFHTGDQQHGGRLDGVRITGGATVRQVVLRARQAAHARVRVSDAADLPVGRAMLLAVDAKGKPLSTLPTFSDAAGRAILNGLPPGPLRVVALSSELVPGYSDLEEIVEARPTDVLVTMGRGPRVKVRVEDASGQVVTGVRLSARWRGGPWIPLALVQRFDAKSGYVDLGHLPPIAVEFRIQSPASTPFVVQRTLPAGSSAALVFTAPK